MFPLVFISPDGGRVEGCKEAGSFYDEGRGGMKLEEERQARLIRSLSLCGSQITTVGTGPGKVPSRPVVGAESYDQGAAPCVCCEGESQNQGTHKLMHQAQARRAHSAKGTANPNPMFPLVTATGEPAKMQTLGDAITSGVESLCEVFSESKCDSGCLEAQLNDYHFKAVNEQGKALPANELCKELQRRRNRGLDAADNGCGRSWTQSCCLRATGG